MTVLTRPIRRLLGRDAATVPAVTAVVPDQSPAPTRDLENASIALDIAETDPLLAYLQSAPGPVDLARLELDSPALTALREAGVALVVPLVSQGELIGTLNLGPRLSEQEYSTDDRRLLSTLAAQAAPAIRVAQLVREQAHEAAERERLEQEMRVATLIQQQFLPRELPSLPQWQIAAYYGPARAVGGDFYDFIEMPGGRIGIAVGDVTDKGVPAALVMARTHSILRAEASRSDSPGAILARANELLVPEMPAKMFVTCLFAILDPKTGHIVLANAGHNLPYVRTDDGVVELRATGMPLGLMADIRYEETEGVIRPGSNVLLYSDGLVEAHDPGQEMFGFPRLREAMTIDDAGSELLDRLLEDLRGFTGPDWEQEDDITLVTLRRASGVSDQGSEAPTMTTGFSIPGEEGNERLAMDRVAAAVADLGISPSPPRAAQDRRQRGDDECHRIRQSGPRRRPSGRGGRGHTRRRHRANHGSRPVGRGARRRREARHRPEACGRPEGARLGPLPDQEHGGFDGRDQRRVDPDGDPDDGAQGADRWMSDTSEPR